MEIFNFIFFATIKVIFGKYDVIHFHAEGTCAMLWLPYLFGIRTVVTIHGLLDINAMPDKYHKYGTFYSIVSDKL